MTKQITQEDLRAAQKNILCKAFDADNRWRAKTALEQLMTCELLATPVKELN